MSFNVDNSSETSAVPMEKSNDLKNRTEELKQSLAIWRKILLPLNNLLQWKRNYDPLIIFGIITFIFIFISQMNPPVLTLSSCLILIIVLIDLLGPIGIQMVFKNDTWTPAEDAEYTKLCEHIANLGQHINHRCQSILTMRKERPMMYLMVGGIFLSFMAFCGQRFDNLLLCYMKTLLICLIPGIRNRQLLPCIRQYITDIWTRKQAVPSYDPTKTKLQ